MSAIHKTLDEKDLLGQATSTISCRTIKSVLVRSNKPVPGTE